MSDIRRIPFTEIVEQTQKDYVRDNSSSESKYKGRVNQVYAYDIPAQIDWRHLRKEANLTTSADYTTGHISATSGMTLTGASTSWTSANSNNLLIKISGYDEIYRCTYVSGTSLTIDRTWIGTDISSNTTYTLFQDRYALASDFERLILDPDKSIYYWRNGIKTYLAYKSPDEFELSQVITPNTPAYYTVKWVNGDPYVFINPPDTNSRTLNYVYIPSLKRMAEYTTGTITTLANGGTAVTGSGTDFDGFVTDTTNYDYYFRLDDDGIGAASVWYKISAAGSDTALTLADAYTGTSVGTAEDYTISMVSQLPAGLDLALILGAALISAVDKDNVIQFDRWAKVYDKILAQFKSVEGKKGYGKGRIRTIYENGCRR